MLLVRYPAGLPEAVQISLDVGRTNTCIHRIHFSRGWSTRLLGAPIDDIEFLARSDHRATVLDLLADRPCDRNGLREATGASSATIGRILGDFEDRRWTTRDGPTYELTPLGEFVREHGLSVSIRGGGHNIAGSALVEDGLTIDMSGLRGVLVDPEARTATAQGGCLVGDVDRETQLHGLATPL